MKRIFGFILLVFFTSATFIFISNILITNTVTGHDDALARNLSQSLPDNLGFQDDLPANLLEEPSAYRPASNIAIDQTSANGINALIDTAADPALLKSFEENVLRQEQLDPVDLNQPPYAPTPIIPVDGANPVHLRDQDSVALQALLSAPDSRELTASFYGRPTCAGSDFTVVVLPDTQYYSSETNNGLREMFDAQTQWIVDNRSELNIAYVTHVGDIVDYAADTNQWDIAGSLNDPIGALTRLDNAGIPYGLAVGNHDGGPNDTSNFNAYFPSSRFGDGNYGDDNDNNYGLFSAGGMDFIVVHLEYGVDDDVLAWANDLLAIQYPDRRAIVVTHDLLDDYVSPAPFSTKGSKIFEALKANPNLFLMLGGHQIGGVSRTDVVDGHTIYSLRSDYQNDGGHGWLRLMEFQPATNQIQVDTYSPYLDEWQSNAGNTFTLDYDMSDTDCGLFELIETVPGLMPGSSPMISWTNRSIGSQYDWYVTVSDGVNTASSPVRTFTTGDGLYVPISLSIDGYSFGLMRHQSTFTATVTPIEAAMPLTFIWTTANQPVITHQNNLTDTVAYSWNTNGSQQINVIAFNAESSATNVFEINLYKPVYANFSFSPFGKLAPFIMIFTNRSVGDYDACTWDFGDGSTSNRCKSQTHIFTHTGVYSVTLTVSGPGGTDTKSRLIDTANPKIVATRLYLPFVFVQGVDNKR